MARDLMRSWTINSGPDKLTIVVSHACPCQIKEFEQLAKTFWAERIRAEAKPEPDKPKKPCGCK